jgi:RNA polymerase primary sigma factor
MQNLSKEDLALIDTLIFPFRSLNVPIEELRQSAVLGLIRAKDKFDATRGVKFVTYAAFWVKRAVYLGAHDSKWCGLKYKHHYNATLCKINKQRGIFYNEYGRYPSTEELSKILEIKEDKLNSILLYEIRGVVPIDGEYNNGEGGFSSFESMYPDDSLNPEEEILWKEKVLLMEEAISSLDQKKQLVVRGRFQGKSLKELGDKLNLTRERIRQINADALERIQIYIKAKNKE